jgi:hypothetical protein
MEISHRLKCADKCFVARAQPQIVLLVKMFLNNLD